MTKRKSILYWATVVLVGCADTDLRSPPAVVFAEFDPTASPPRVPTPTDLARDPTTGRIQVPLPADASAAERELAAYLESLDAFPPSSHATATFTEPLAPTSTNSVVILDLTDHTMVQGATVTIDGQKMSIIAPGGAWIGGHTYAIAITNAARGAGGEPVVASPAFFFARSLRPISNCTAPAADCASATPFLSVDQAIGLERLRQALAPLFAAFEAAGVAREHVVLAWSFTISTRPFGAYDPAAARIPFPNDILRDPVTGRVQLPIPPNAPPAEAQLVMQLNELTGFSTTAQVTAPVDLPPGDALPATVTGVVTTMPDTAIATVPGDVVLVPRTPLPEKTTFLVVLTRAVTDQNGQPLEPPPLMILLRGEAPLVENGVSTVSVLTDAEAVRLEPLRVAMNGAMAAAGLPRDQVVVAWGFTTQPTVSVLADRIATLPPPSSTGDAVSFPPNVPHSSIATLIAGTFTGSKADAVPYLLTIPSSPTGGLVIFQHGLSSDKSAVFALADTFAGVGLTTVAMDLPLHGDRAQPGHPFFDFSNLGAIRDALLQSEADLAQLARTAKGPGLAGHSFAATPSFVGVSLGGIVGTPFAALVPPARTVQSTTGASVVDIALLSPTFRPMVEQALAAAGIHPGTPQYEQFVVFARMELDAGDPINYAVLLRTLPVLAQVASDDTVIPAPLGVHLGGLSGASVTTFVGSQHAALINPMDPNVAAAQEQVVRFILGGGL